LLEAHRQFLDDADLDPPERTVFRAGGWDHGSSAEDMRRYIQGLEANGVTVDSSATTGVFGTDSWQVGRRFGENTFWLTPSLIEVAPCSFMSCGDVGIRAVAAEVYDLTAQARSPRTLNASGVMVTVLHFDHLFRTSRGPFTSWSERDVTRRIDRFFTRIERIQRLLGLRSATFEDLQLPGRVTREQSSA
jgi:hypothetical protein